MVEMAMSLFLFNYERLENFHSDDTNFNGYTHKANAFKAALKETSKGLKVRRGKDITGPELAIILLFQCEVEIVEWRVQGRENLDLEIK